MLLFFYEDYRCEKILLGHRENEGKLNEMLQQVYTIRKENVGRVEIFNTRIFHFDE